jgi:hypothetical protein
MLPQKRRHFKKIVKGLVESVGGSTKRNSTRVSKKVFHQTFNFSTKKRVETLSKEKG